MGLKKFFWDSYAIIEIVKGNINYFSYGDEQIIFSIFNLVEIYFAILRDFGKKTAEGIYEKYYPAVINIPDNILKEAMEFRLKNKTKRLSYADCIGYMYALRNNMFFLTGDKEFENLKNVEFVKK